MSPGPARWNLISRQQSETSHELQVIRGPRRPPSPQGDPAADIARSGLDRDGERCHLAGGSTRRRAREAPGRRRLTRVWGSPGPGRRHLRRCFAGLRAAPSGCERLLRRTRLLSSRPPRPRGRPERPSLPLSLCVQEAAGLSERTRLALQAPRGREGKWEGRAAPRRAAPLLSSPARRARSSQGASLPLAPSLAHRQVKEAGPWPYSRALGSPSGLSLPAATNALSRPPY